MARESGSPKAYTPILSRSSSSQQDKEHTEREPCRTSSVVGTLEYMAPEIVIMFGKRTLNKDGYTSAVDFWSLGIMIYKLLTGDEPFNKMSYEYLQAVMPRNITCYNSYYESFTSLFGELDFDNVQGVDLSYDTQDLLYGLLTFDASQRLGYNAEDMKAGHDALMNHPFFSSINWPLLESRQIPPPYIPKNNELSECMQDVDCTPRTLPELLIQASKDNWCEEFLTNSENSNKDINNRPMSNNGTKRSMLVAVEDQVYFSGWNYIHCVE